jgi:hypothetical protein
MVQRGPGNSGLDFKITDYRYLLHAVFENGKTAFSLFFSASISMHTFLSGVLV